MHNYKNYCLVLMLSFCAVFIVPNTVNAQDQFGSSFNFESSSLPYKWQTSSWTTCAGECNNGNQTREVSCRDNAGNPAPSEADCAHSARPELLRTCDLPDFQWKMEDCPSHVHNSGGGGVSNVGSNGMSESNPGVSDAADGPGGTSGGSSGRGGGNGTGGGQM